MPKPKLLSPEETFEKYERRSPAFHSPVPHSPAHFSPVQTPNRTESIIFVTNSDLEKKKGKSYLLTYSMFSSLWLDNLHCGLSPRLDHDYPLCRRLVTRTWMDIKTMNNIVNLALFSTHLQKNPQ